MPYLKDYMGLSTFSCLCCCWCIGIFAINKSSEVQDYAVSYFLTCAVAVLLDSLQFALSSRACQDAKQKPKMAKSDVQCQFYYSSLRSVSSIIPVCAVSVLLFHGLRSVSFIIINEIFTHGNLFSNY